MDTSNAEEGYIDIEVNIISESINSPQEEEEQTREFEFQVSSSTSLKDTERLTSPADELFYNGKLLPLELPPRLRMIQRILLDTTKTTVGSSNSAATMKANPTDFMIAFESCGVSSTESCRVSTSDVPPDDNCFFEGTSNEINNFVEDQQHSKKYSWTKKIKKQSLGQKVVNASSAYFKALFTKSACTDSNCNEEAETGSATRYSKLNSKKNKNPFVKTQNHEGCETKISTLIKNIDRDIVERSDVRRRNSFSGEVQWYSATKCLPLQSSSSSTSSSGSGSGSCSFSFCSHGGFCDMELLKRSSRANSEPESSIEGAIAHCKKC